jgi:hypothetical protein
MKDRIGIWIDKKVAFIIRLNGDKPDVEKLDSSIPDFHPKGGHRSKQPWGPVDTVKEKAYLAKEQLAIKEFFFRIYDRVAGVKQLYIFGPAQMKDELSKFLDGQYNFKPDFLKIDPADSMTENQMVAKAKGILEPA